jgi:ketosteroid isomerase-like protein
MPATEEAGNLAVVRGYYAAITHGAAGLDWERWFAPDVVQEELPNRLLPAGTRRDLRAMQEAAQRARRSWTPGVRAARAAGEWQQSGGRGGVARPDRAGGRAV